MFKLEVKTTDGGVRRAKLFGAHHSWLMHEKHGQITDKDLIYAFVLLGEREGRLKPPRFFLVPAADVARYIRWNHMYYLRYAKRRKHEGSSLRVFRIPAEALPNTKLPPSWRDGRWRRYEGNWGIFGPSPVE